jgi:hypothetical protein
MHSKLTGDSITAAFAARGFLNEDRDISWSAGQGLDSQVTLPYMLNQYKGPIRPVQGVSTKAVLPNNITHLPHGDYHPATDHFNFAESSGAVHRNSLEEQWAYVLQHMNDFPNVQERWKVCAVCKSGHIHTRTHTHTHTHTHTYTHTHILALSSISLLKVFTLWMTANDVCGECNGPMDIVQWSARTQQLLLNITNTFKNIYVNLVGTLDLSNVARIQRSDLFCKIEHSVLKECGCIDRGNSSQLLQLDENVHKVNAELHRIAQKFTTMLQQQGRTDMAVVMQGFQEGVGKTLTRKFLSNLDCFHPSTTG